MQNVAVLGLGIMGGGMADNLLKAGFSVSVYNRTRAKAEPFAAKGARVADTPCEAAQGADLVFSMVGDDEASRAVWLGNDGGLAGAKQGAILVECSTLTPDWVRELAKLATDRGMRFLDAPVTGSKQAAATGALRLLVGGDATTLDNAKPALQAISNDIVHMGSVGAGATYKLINNMMGAVHVAALSEGIALAERAGLNMEQVSQLILSGPTASPMVKGKLDRMLAHRYDETDFSIRWMAKDARYAVALAKEFGSPVTAVAAAHEAFQKAQGMGFADSDIAALVESVRK